MISSMSVPICNHFHARQANRPKGKITFLREVPMFHTLVPGEPPHPALWYFVTKY